MIKLELKDDRLPTELPSKEASTVYARILATFVTIAVADFVVLALVLVIQALLALPSNVTVVMLVIGVVIATAAIMGTLGGAFRVVQPHP